MGYNFFNIVRLKDNLRMKNKLKSFVNSLGLAISEGRKIPFADNDISYVLELQHNRIKDKGLDIEYLIYDRDNTRDATIGSQWKDTRYESFVCSEQYGVKRKITKDGRVLYSDKKRNILYTTITDVISGVHPDDEIIPCPNCGNVSTIAQIQGGCPYCGTMYKMDDLFPKVTGYHFMEDVAVAGNEHKIGMALSIAITVIVLEMIMFIAALVRGEAFEIETILTSVLMIFLGALFGYFGYGIYLLVRLFSIGPRQSAGKWGTIGSRKSFEQRMKAISPEFSFEYFTSKAISLIKTSVYAPNEQDLMFYKGQPLDPQFKNIIDMNYGGALGLADFRDEYGKVVVTTDAFFDVLYAEGDTIINRREVFKAVFRRRTDIPVDMQFSMAKIQCASCGSSFNAIQNKYCPYCGTEYNIESQDWILTDLSRKYA